MRTFISRLSQASSWLAFCLLGCLLVPACGRSPSAAPGPAGEDAASKGTVTLEVVEGTDRQRYDIPGVAAGSTVESILRGVTEPEVTITGSGVTAFVDSINGKSTTSSEGWTYRVDGVFANEGIGSTTVDPPVTITWTFGEMEPQP